MDALFGLGEEAMQSEGAKMFAGEDAEPFLQQKFGLLPILHLGNRLDDYFFRLKQSTGETMAGWSIRSERSLPPVTPCPGTSKWKENQDWSARQFCSDET